MNLHSFFLFSQSSRVILVISAFLLSVHSPQGWGADQDPCISSPRYQSRITGDTHEIKIIFTRPALCPSLCPESCQETCPPNGQPVYQKCQGCCSYQISYVTDRCPNDHMSAYNKIKYIIGLGDLPTLRFFLSSEQRQVWVHVYNYGHYPISTDFDWPECTGSEECPTATAFAQEAFPHSHTDNVYFIGGVELPSINNTELGALGFPGVIRIQSGSLVRRHQAIIQEYSEPGNITITPTANCELPNPGQTCPVYLEGTSCMVTITFQRNDYQDGIETDTDYLYRLRLLNNGIFLTEADILRRNPGEMVNLINFDDASFPTRGSSLVNIQSVTQTNEDRVSVALSLAPGMTSLCLNFTIQKIRMDGACIAEGNPPGPGEMSSAATTKGGQPTLNNNAIGLVIKLLLGVLAAGINLVGT